MFFKIKKSLTQRIVFYVLTLCILIFLTSLTLFYLSSKKQLENVTYKNTAFITENTALKIESILTPIMKIAHNYQWMLLQIKENPDSIAALTQRIVSSNPEIMGSAVAFVPDYFSSKGKYFAPYSYRNGDTIVTMQLGNENYEYFYMDWFQIPTSINKPYWTEPYYDTGGANALMTTFSIPITIDSAGVPKTIAVLTVDLALDWFTEIVSSVKVLETGYASVISKAGTFLTHPKKELIMNQTIFSYAKENSNDELRAIGREMQTKKNGFANSTLNGVHRIIYYTTLPSSNWSLAVVFPKSEIYLPLRKITIILIALIVIALTLLTVIISKVIGKQLIPLTAFAKSARQIAKGDFQTPIPQIKTEDEMLELHDAFHFMQNNLLHYIETLKDTTSAKEKIESELRIAREIQMGMIPKTFPPFPTRKELDQYATLIPAKEVGGDLYDYFIDDDKLYFIIGDVSGKGIPASLLMAVTRSLFRSVTLHFDSPAVILTNLNNSLAENNDSNMFVTLFLGILDLNSGQLQFCNAGHNPPILIRVDASFMEVIPNLPLGLIDGFQYQQQEKKIYSGTTLVLYTDGLTEAENESQKLYGDERLLQLISSSEDLNTQNLVETIIEDVHAHVQTADQSDDLTLMAIKYNGPTPKYEKSVSLINEIDQIYILQQFIEEVGEDLDFEASLVMKLNLALEEAVSNVILYAYPKVSGKKIIVSVAYKGSDLIFTVTDTGVPFDPTLTEHPNLDLDAEERPIGGLGIFLIKQIMNEVTYSRIHDVNVFTMKKKIDPKNE
jgi:sigma-B regulation protein RsbU (phosphoserine phosphatase)